MCSLSKAQITMVSIIVKHRNLSSSIGRKELGSIMNIKVRSMVIPEKIW
jgi:hypothetical protein